MSRIVAAIACLLLLFTGAVFLPSQVLAGSATVSWNANAEPDLAKYRVYWSTTAGSYGNYQTEVLKGTQSYTGNSFTDGQTYYFAVTAVDTAGNESGFSSPAVSKTFTAAGGGGSLTAPVLVSPTNGAHVSGSAVTFKWQAIQAATDYNLTIYASNGGVALSMWLGNTTSYTVNGFDNTGRAYTWTITARNSSGQGPASAAWAFVNDGNSGTPTVPPAPALLTPAKGATVPGTSVTFTWQAAQGATDYDLKVTDSSGGTTFDTWLGNVQSYTATGFANTGKVYNWTVTARNQAGQGPSAAQQSFTNGSSTAPTIPPAPLQVSPANSAHVPGTSLTFTWRAAQGATDYNLKIYLTSGAVAFDQWLGNALSYTVPGFSNTGKAFAWAITARNQAGQGPSSPQWSFVNDAGGTNPTVPPAPVLSTPANGGNVAGSSVTFTWQAAQGATDYELKVTDSNGGSAFDRWLGNVQSYTVTGFANTGKVYNWTVTARNQAGQGPASGARSFTNGSSGSPTVPPAPVLTSPSNGATVSGSSVTFKWQPSAGATDYNLIIYASNGGVALNMWLGNTTSYTVNGFDRSGRAYTWVIVPRNSAGQGPSSAKWAFTNR